MRFPEYSNMKDSGVEWFGDIPKHWNSQRMKWFCNKITDGSHYSPLAQINGRFYVTVKDIVSDSVDLNSAAKISDEDFRLLEKSGCRPQVGDVLFSKDGTIGKVAVVDRDDYVVLSSLAILRPKEDNYSNFLGYFLKSKPGINQIESRFAGAALKRITLDVIIELLVLKLPITEQINIASFLDCETSKIDFLISKKEQLIKLLQEKRIAIISHAVTKGLDPNVKMKDSKVEWLGEIPEHWEVKKIKYIVKQHPNSVKTGPFGSQLLSSEMMSGQYKVYNQRNVISGDITLGDNYISHDKFKELSAFQLFPDDLLITTRGTIGRCLILSNQMEKGILHPCLMRIQINNERLLSPLLVHIIQNSSLFKSQIELLSNATTIEVIYSDTIRKLIIPCPPLPEQVIILRYLDQETSKIDSLISKVKEAIEKLKEYRTALISAAVTGKIDVRREVH
jgi:type I restriction enzyme S subunit